MTATLISLFSVVVGIITANLTGYFFKKYSFGVIGNTIIGVFGSVFIIKSFGRLGFDPGSIIQPEGVNMLLLVINLIASFLGGSFAIVLVRKLKNLMNKEKVNK
jgi:uncharacterized membrane protein YeaQ/YmgE (transglycosylase-associated protein family)